MSSNIIEICKITEIKDIEGANRIELATVKGWQCIVAKNMYKI